GDERFLIMLNGNVNHGIDVQSELNALYPILNRGSRVLLLAYNPYMRIIFQILTTLGIRKGEVPQTFLTRPSLESLCKLSSFEIVRMRCVGYVPRLLGLGSLLNAVYSSLPFTKWFGFVTLIYLRPVKVEESPKSLTILIPARNEAGNIENAIKRLDDFSGDKHEIIFIEGHSSDNTWEEIQRVRDAYKNRFRIKCYQQSGKGKSDAVRLGFQHAECDLVTILDADLTMPPEKLKLFYDAYHDGLGDFINGDRLLYPMDNNAMRFLNHLGNLGFTKLLSIVLEVHLGDVLCGTKLFSRRDYGRFETWRKDFGDIDPFGDFELLFPAAQLGLGVVDLPIVYKAREYGETQISRFRHGLILIKMTLHGLFKIRMSSLVFKHTRKSD
ncbi:glycosyltransferase family 2 protein, partial [bacterium AH-315-E10]|nr:glycosyltransferase family 2 protein [bacterium AH-315-E10]